MLSDKLIINSDSEGKALQRITVFSLAHAVSSWIGLQKTLSENMLLCIPCRKTEGNHL